MIWELIPQLTFVVCTEGNITEVWWLVQERRIDERKAVDALGKGRANGWIEFWWCVRGFLESFFRSENSSLELGRNSEVMASEETLYDK